MARIRIRRIADDLVQAEAVLLKIRPYIRNINSSEYIEALANGDLCVAVGYNGDVMQARDRAREANKGIDIKYAVPKEGSILWFDMLAIPKDAPDPDSAYAFMNYIMTPQVIADISNFKRYANGNAASQPLVSAVGQGRSGNLSAPGAAAEARGAAGGFGRSNPRHHPRLAKVQDGPIGDDDIRRSGRQSGALEGPERASLCAGRSRQQVLR